MGVLFIAVIVFSMVVSKRRGKTLAVLIISGLITFGLGFALAYTGVIRGIAGEAYGAMLFDVSLLAAALASFIHAKSTYAKGEKKPFPSWL